MRTVKQTDHHKARDRVRVSVNVLVFKNDTVLLGKRAGANGRGSWCLPGGHLEFGESMVEAAKRELFEETGIQADEFVFANVVNEPREDMHYVCVNFRAAHWSGEPRVAEPEKFSEWKWFPLDELPAPMFTHHETLITLAQQGKPFYDLGRETYMVTNG